MRISDLKFIDRLHSAAFNRNQGDDPRALHEATRKSPWLDRFRVVRVDRLLLHETANFLSNHLWTVGRPNAPVLDSLLLSGTYGKVDVKTTR